MSDIEADAAGRPGAPRDGLVTLWAVLGFAWAVFALWGTIYWFASGQAVAVPIQGPDVYASWRLVGMRVLEASSMAFVFGGIYFWLYKPLRHERRLTLPGMLLIGGCVGFFMDPVVNNFHYTFAWNQHAVNLGTWASFFPTWAPQGAYAEGMLWAFPQYIMMGAGSAVFGCWIVTSLRKRYPGIGLTSALAVVFMVHFVADFVVENTFIFFEVYALARTQSAVTLWAGQLNQFPIYESILVAAQSVPLALLMLSSKESPDGLSFVERGAGRYPAGLRTWVRCFAIIGFAFFIFSIYFFPSSWLSVTADSVIQLPSYLQANPM